MKRHAQNEVVNKIRKQQFLTFCFKMALERQLQQKVTDNNRLPQIIAPPLPPFPRHLLFLLKAHNVISFLFNGLKFQWALFDIIASLE